MTEPDSLANLLLLTSVALVSAGCAKGAEGPGPRPGVFGTGAGNEDPGDPWTNPIDTTGAESGSDGSTSGFDEGETGQVSSETGEFPTGAESSGGDGPSLPPEGEDGGDEGGEDTSTGYGYDDPPLPTGDPCPALAQLYSSCNADYLYADEIQACDAARAQAQSISGAGPVEGTIGAMSGSVTRARVPSADAHPADPPAPVRGQGRRW